MPSHPRFSTLRSCRRSSPSLTTHALSGALLVLCICANVQAQSSEVAPLYVGQFEQTQAPWEEIRLSEKLKPNQYELKTVEGVAALQVTSHNSMSLFGRSLQDLPLDLGKTPVLCWRWRIDAPLKTANIQEKSGDDYAARLYISLQIPEDEQGFFLKTQLGLARSIWGPHVPDAALNYVWDNQQPVGTTLPNAYTDRTMMIVQRSGSEQAGQWQWESVNVAQDAKKFFGPSALPVQIAITSDTDNTGEQAVAAFADLHFIAPHQNCGE